MSDTEQSTGPEPTIAEPPPLWAATDLRSGTEVHPAVVDHHAAFLAGAPYDTPYDFSAPKEKNETGAQ